MKITIGSIITRLESLADAEAVAGMARYGIRGKKVYGVKIPELRRIGKELGREHGLSLRLWSYPSRETRILAALTGEPEKVTIELMEEWVKEFDSWEICDQIIMNLFEKTEWAHSRAVEWSSRKEEFVKRAGFVLMARLAVSDKGAPDQKFLDFFPCIIAGSTDDRIYVKKGVNWAVRQIGKRNLVLHAHAINLAREIQRKDSPAARWIASDALRELKSEAVLNRLRERSKT